MFGPFWNNPGYHFPYTSMQEMNLDWLLRTVKYLSDNFPEFGEELNKKLNKPVVNPDGSLNDLLLSNGDGTTRWEPLDITIGNEIQEAVDAWLVAHPEATTTVQDGTISPAKLNTELYNFYKQQGKVQFFFPDLSAGGYSGTSVLMVTPDKTVLFDTNATVNKTPVISYYTALMNAGVFSNIDVIVISHYHWDHVENLQAILDAFPHANCKLYCPLSPSGYYAGSTEPDLITNFNTVASIASTYALEYHIVDEDSTITIDNLVKINMFNSDATSYTYYSNSQAPYNDYSMVSLVKIGSIYAMFPGDLQSIGQARVMSYKQLPRLFLYNVHHHSIQNDDFVPYIHTIDPDYNIITTSYNRQLISARSSMFVKLSTGRIGSTAYDSYSLVCDGQSGEITHGLALYVSGWTNTNINLYVNNEYTGDIHDGSVAHPFTKISEACMFIKYARHLRYTINVQHTATAYTEDNFVRDISTPLVIQGVDNPDISWLYIQDCSKITLRGLAFSGEGYPGYPFTGRFSSLVLMNSLVIIDSCSFDGTAMDTDGTVASLQDANVRILSSTVTDYYSGFGFAYTSTLATLEVSDCTFSDITETLFSLTCLKLYLQDGNTFSNIGYLLAGDPNKGIPAVVHRSYLTAAFASNCTASAVTEPVYVSATNPVVMMSNKKIFDVLTGQETT